MRPRMNGDPAFLRAKLARVMEPHVRPLNVLVARWNDSGRPARYDDAGWRCVVGPYVQIGGSLVVLITFVFVQWGRLRTTSMCYAVLNLTGSAVLAVNAALGRQWGFVLLEGTWAVVWSISVARRAAPR
jgi:hypothetical protein